MGIPLNLDFEMGVAKPIDSRLVMTKAQMASVNDDVMPSVYGCWCSEDGRFYIYDKRNVTVVETGKFVLQPDNFALDEVMSAVNAQRGFIESINALQSKVDNIENAMRGDKEVFIITQSEGFVEGVWKKDFLPQHEKSSFCQEVTLKYTGVFSETDADSVIVNGQSISLGKTHSTEMEETTEIKVVGFGKTLNVLCDNVIVGNVPDSILLTVEIDSANISNGSVHSIQSKYSFVDYADVNVKSKNGKAITETYEGEIVYWTTNFALGNAANSLSDKHSLAVYSIGNYTGSGQYMFKIKTGATYADFEEYNIIRHVYMANWDLSGVTNFTLMFMLGSESTSATYTTWQKDPLVFTKGLRHLDFTNVKFPSGGITRFQPVDRPNGSSIGSLANCADLIKHGTNMTLNFSRLREVKSLGDLSNWDFTNVSVVSEMFSRDMFLQFVGDVGKWNIGSQITNIKNMFRECFELRGISSDICFWDVSNVVGMNNTFDSTLNIGDETLRYLWKWDTSKVANFKFMFAYMTWRSFKSNDKSGCGLEMPAFAKEIATNNEAIIDGVSAENQRQREEANLAIIKEHIVAQKSDLSFIDQWNVSACSRFTDMCSFNPYLTNLGDLRKWEIVDTTYADTEGFTGFIQYCTALETFMMPSIPIGMLVTDIVKGCVSLANIEVNALSNDISFEDCPLTKQSVLNLINAATDDVTITLKADIYSTMVADADVQSAIASKLNDGITVNLATNA